MGLGFRADGTLWGISAKTSLFINPEAWSAQQGEEGVLEGKELGLVINEHTKEPLTFQPARATGARRPCGKAETRVRLHTRHSRGSIFFLQNTMSFNSLSPFYNFLPSPSPSEIFFHLLGALGVVVGGGGRNSY